MLLSVLLRLLQHKSLPVRADNDHTACTHLLAWNNFHNQSENQYPTLSCNESISTLSVDNLGLVFLGNEKMLYTMNWINCCAVLSAPTSGSSQTVAGSLEAHVQIPSLAYTFFFSSPNWHQTVTNCFGSRFNDYISLFPPFFPDKYIAYVFQHLIIPFHNNCILIVSINAAIQFIPFWHMS